MKKGYIYILANKKNGAIYTGVTSDLISRVHQHKNNLADGFTKKYNIHNLVYFEEADDIRAAIQREKNLKKYPRKWKTDLINKNNSDWKDLYPAISDPN